MSTSDLGDVCAFAVMAKAPRAGEVKTRLVPPLLPEEAAELSACSIQDVVENFLGAGRAVKSRGYVAYSPPGSEALFRELVPPEIELLAPRRIGLGHSLLHAAEDLLALGYGAACLVNADSPTLPSALLIEAAERLHAPGDRVVLGPACDGGYYLIGLKQPHRHLFHDIDWSTERVFRQTVKRATSLGLAVAVLPTWYDVDDPASLAWLCDEVLFGRCPADFTGEGYAAQHVARLLRRLAASDAAARLGIERRTEEVAP
ncbi:MAG: TIGR04282 family arsenosugar biosynthesis glycosyltransferase [Stellaceae bacterium]